MMTTTMNSQTTVVVVLIFAILISSVQPTTHELNQQHTTYRTGPFFLGKGVSTFTGQRKGAERPEGSLGVVGLSISLLAGDRNPLPARREDIGIRYLMFSNSKQEDYLCDGGQVFAAFGEELTPINLPGFYAYPLASDVRVDLNFEIYRLAEQDFVNTTTWIEYTYTYVTLESDDSDVVKPTTPPPTTPNSPPTRQPTFSILPVVPVYIDVVGCDDEEWVLVGDGTLEEKSRVVQAANQITVVLAIGHVDPTGGVAVTLVNVDTDQRVCESKPEYSGKYVHTMSPCTPDIMLQLADHLEVTASYQYDKPVTVSGAMMTYSYVIPGHDDTWYWYVIVIGVVFFGVAATMIASMLLLRHKSRKRKFGRTKYQPSKHDDGEQLFNMSAGDSIGYGDDEFDALTDDEEDQAHHQEFAGDYDDL